ncbi:MAG TPA: hypothetical protein VGS22_09400 [Thermoanaerobaculia bacterium]|jgi:hypothetical protein|nr:hypothetical protein [Thermoanaerobaculia bacterium]
MNEPVAPITPGAPIASAEPVAPPPSPSGLQFDRVELEAAPAVRQAPECAFCRIPLRSFYFDVNGRMACEACRFKIEEQFKKGPGAAGFLRAAGAGLGAAIAGSALYYAVRALTGYEIGLISILVGFMVGKAVRWGVRGRGGWVFQTLAMFLTYMAIVSTYIPLLINEIKGQMESKPAVVAPAVTSSGSAAAHGAGKAKTSEPGSKKPTEDSSEEMTFGKAVVGVLAIFALAAAVPFLAGFENILGLVIIAFGLWEAWKLNKRPAIAILGPLDLGRAPSSVPAEA